MLKFLRNIPKFIALPFAVLLSACTSAQIAESGSLAADAVGLLTTGASDYASVQAALTAGQQVLGGHGISLGNLSTYASAILTPANGQLASNVVSNLGNAVAVVSSDINALVNSGASTATISANIAAAQTAVPVSTTTSKVISWTPVKLEG